MKTVAGSKEHCCVPRCSASSRYNSVLSFHRFPQDASLRAKWLHGIRRVQFTVTQHTKVCSRHFEESLIRTTAKGKRVLSRDAVPSLFDWNDYSVKRRTGVWERRPKPSTSEPEPEDIEDVPDEAVPDEEAVPMEHEARPTVCVDKEEYERMKSEIEALREQLQTLHLKNSFGLQRFASSPEDIRFYTR
uniref:THAP domain-containing protein 1 n=2 Tax=Sparus aurata TaxID=8175 RepID=A0A671UEU0_SPAAU